MVAPNPREDQPRARAHAPRGALGWRVLRASALVAVLAWLLACGTLAAMQHSLIFRPVRGLTATPDARGLPYEDVMLTAADGVAIHGWYLPAPDGARGRHVLFLHGNAGNLSHRLYTLGVLHRLGHPVLVIDYRGYGRSAGRPSEDGLHADALAAWQHLTVERGIAPADIVLYGRSLGGAVAARLAAAVGPGALVLESTFSSLRELAAIHYPYAPAGWLLAYEFDTAAHLRDLRCPLLIAHGRDDEIVPWPLASRLVASAPPHTFVALSGSHNRAFRASAANYHGRLRAFIGEHTNLPGDGGTRRNENPRPAARDK